MATEHAQGTSLGAGEKVREEDASLGRQLSSAWSGCYNEEQSGNILIGLVSRVKGCHEALICRGLNGGPLDGLGGKLWRLLLVYGLIEMHAKALVLKPS